LQKIKLDWTIRLVIKPTRKKVQLGSAWSGVGYQNSGKG
jgi:hypothetical protein